MPTLPSPSDIPSTLHPIIHPSGSSPSSISNILLILHGLGDTSTNFSSFPRALNLPETLTITLQGPTPLPHALSLPGEGYHWGDDIVFDSSGDIDPDAGFSRSRALVGEDVVRKLLIEKCGFKGREILIFGFGQGAMLGLAVAKDLGAHGTELGGVISIGGGLPQSARLVSGEKCKTPVLLLGGSRGVFSPQKGTAVKAVQGTFENVEFHQWKKGDDGMPGNREEVLPLMQFFGRRLRSRKGVPEGAVEIG